MICNALARSSGGEIDQHVFGDALSLERCGSGRERLRRRRHFTWHGRLRDGTFLDRPDRLTGHAVKDKEEALLGHLGDRLDRTTVHVDVDQGRRGGGIPVPDGVMDQLEVPDPFARLGVETDQALREQVVAWAMPPIPVVRLAADRQIDVAELRVHRHQGPDVDRPGVTPRLRLPGLAAVVGLVRDRVERPAVLAGADIVGAHVSGWDLACLWGIADRRADDDDVARHERRRRQRVGVPRHMGTEVPGEIDLPPIAEVGVQRARARVDRDERRLRPARVEQPLAVVVSPVRQSLAQEPEVGRPAGPPDLRVD